MAWLAAWFAFGLLAAYEAGEIALHSGGDGAPIRSLAYLVCSAGALTVIGGRAIRSAQPKAMRSPLALSLLALAVCLWGLGQDSGWVTAAMAGAAYMLVCLVIGGVVAFLAWRRLVAQEEQLALTRIERERQTRLERIRAETVALASTQEADLDANGDFTLPARPKWDD